jgi:zinc transport system ATP-binding protein
MQLKSEILVKIEHVGFDYVNEQVLSDISLEIKRGEFLGIIGPNGSGKTTLLKIILGLLKPKTGSVHLFGQDIANFNKWSKVGYVPQKVWLNASSFPITVEEIIGLGLVSNRRILDFINKPDRLEITRSLIAVGLENKRKRLISELSGGQQQRVFIARALVSNPELLVLDEPTVGVDIKSQEYFYELLRDLNQRLQLTLILVSHDIEVVAHEVTHIACINHKIVSHGHPKDVLVGDFMERLYGKDLRFVIHGH